MKTRAMGGEVNRSFLEQQMKAYVESWASRVVDIEPPLVMGFGLARVKSEGEAIRYDGVCSLHFQDIIRGRVTPGRLRKLLSKAEGYVRRAAGFHPWDAILWRAEPELLEQNDFAADELTVKLWFRAVLINDGAFR